MSESAASPDLADSELEGRVRAALVASGEPFEIMSCDPALADTAEFCAAYGYSPDQSANTIVAVGKSDPPLYAACIVLATTRLDVNGVVRRRLEVRKASFAPAAETAAITGMRIGGVTPFALPTTLPIWVDSEVTRRDTLVLGGGSRSIKILLPAAHLAGDAERDRCRWPGQPSRCRPVANVRGKSWAARSAD